jgi:hypothetical protein
MPGILINTGKFWNRILLTFIVELFEKPANPVSKAQKRYAAFVEVHGELFERKVVPMDAEDVRNVEYNYRFTKRITIPVTLGVTVTLFCIILWLGIDWYKAIVGPILILGLAGFLASLVSHYKELLEKKEKTVNKGMVTQKKVFSSGHCYLFLSEQQHVEVTKKGRVQQVPWGRNRRNLLPLR